MSYMVCPVCGEANGVVNTTIFQCRCNRSADPLLANPPAPLEAQGKPPLYNLTHCRVCGRSDNMHGPDGKSTDGTHYFEAQGKATQPLRSVSSQVSNH